MRLAAKITTVLIVGILLLLVIDQFIILKYENDQWARDMRIDASELGTTISHIVDDMWELGGQTRALRTLQEIDALGERTHVRLVYFDVDPTHTDAPTNPNVDFERLRTVMSDHYEAPDGLKHMCTYARLTVESRPAAIELSELIEHEDRNTAFFAIHAAILIGATALLGAVMAVVIGGTWVGRPLQKLIEKTRRIGDGDLSTPVEMHRKDEFGELAHALNSMCDQLRVAQSKIEAEAQARSVALEQLRHADRLRTVGRLAAGIAHELGTPLNVISGRAGLIASGRLDADASRSSATTIKNETDRMAAIIRQLLDFARRNTPHRKSIDLPSLTRQTIQLLEPIAEKRQSSIALTEAPPQLSVSVDSGQIQQVLTNLIVNGVESMPNGGQVELKIEQVMACPPESANGPDVACARIAVLDHGEGMPPEVLDQVFEPFFTTKDVGEGTGLGLSIAYSIVQEHGGWIDVSSQPGQGSCFTVYLPVENAACQDES
jgi:signal transduction histidine kinase